MKKLVLTFLSISLLLFSSQLLAFNSNKLSIKTKLQEKKEKMEEVLFQKMKLASPDIALNYGSPGNSSDYIWTLTDWTHTSNSEYSYNAMGYLVETTMYDAILGMPLYRSATTYDEHNNFTGWLYYVYEGEDWVMSYGSRIIYVYSSGGQILETTYQYYDSFQMDWVNTSRTLHAHDANNHLIEEIYQYWGIEDWINDWKDEFEVNAQGEWTGVVTSQWYGESWEMIERVTDIVWYNWEMQQLTSAVLQIYSGGSWYNSERESGTFNGENYSLLNEHYWGEAWHPYERQTYTHSSMESVLLSEFYSDDNWINSERTTSYYDEHGTPSGSMLEYWESEKIAADEGWVISYASAEQHTYDEDGNVTETIFQNWDFSTQALVNTNKSVYSNFTAEIQEIGTDLSLRIFPNPVSDQLKIQSLHEQDNNLSYRFMDLSGRLILQGEIIQGQTSIHIQHLPAGVYMLSLINEEGMGSTYKILKN